MKISPSLNEVKTIAASGRYRVLPVSCEILSDFTTPIEVMRILKNVSTHCYMLESAWANEKWGRYTFLGFDPKLEITCTDGRVTIRGGTSVTVETDEPGKYIRQIIMENRSPRLPGLPTFTGGLAGYFSYDYIKYSEPSLRLDAEDGEGFLSLIHI